MTKGNSEPPRVEDAVVVDTLKGLYSRLEDFLQQVRETRGWIDELEGEVGGKQNVIKMGMVLEEKAAVAIGAGLAVLDKQLQEIATFLKISEMPDARIEEDWVGKLLVTIDVLGQRADMIATEVRKLR